MIQVVTVTVRVTKNGSWFSDCFFSNFFFVCQTTPFKAKRKKLRPNRALIGVIYLSRGTRGYVTPYKV